LRTKRSKSFGRRSMRLRDAVRYALYVSREVGEHRFGASKTVVLRAKFLDLVMKLLHYGYTKKAGHTKKLLGLVMSPDPVARERPKESGDTRKDERDQKEATSTENVIKLFWNAMRDVDEDNDLRVKIREILRKLYEKAFREDQDAGERFDEAYATCTAGARAAVSGRKRAKTRLKVKRVTAETAFATAVHDAIRLQTGVDIVLRTPQFHNEAGDIVDSEDARIVKHYATKVFASGVTQNFTIVLVAGYEKRKKGENKKGAATVRFARVMPGRPAEGSGLIMDFMFDSLDSNSKKSAISQLHAHSRVKSMAGVDAEGHALLGSVVVFLLARTEHPQRAARAHGERDVGPSVSAYLLPEHGNAGIFGDSAVCIASAEQALEWKSYQQDRDQRPKVSCGKKTPSAGSKSRFVEHLYNGGVILDPSREGRHNNVFSTYGNASEYLENLSLSEKATLKKDAIRYNSEVYARARTYELDVVAAWTEITLEEDDGHPQYHAIARCVALKYDGEGVTYDLALCVVDATKLDKSLTESVSAIPDGWLGLLVAMACNPRILLVATNKQHEAIVAEVDRVAKLEPVPSGQSGSATTAGATSGEGAQSAANAGRSATTGGRGNDVSGTTPRTSRSAEGVHISTDDGDSGEVDAAQRQTLGANGGAQGESLDLAGEEDAAAKNRARKAAGAARVYEEIWHDARRRRERKENLLIEFPSFTPQIARQQADARRTAADADEGDEPRRKRGAARATKASLESDDDDDAEEANVEEANAEKANAEEREPVFAPAYILGNTYSVSERGCELETSACALKDSIKAKLQRENAKLRFLLVKPLVLKRGTPRHNHHARGVVDAPRCLYMKCGSRGNVDAEVTTRTQSGIVTAKKVQNDAIPEQVELADRIYVLCTSP
jgi:hypothetical protein